MGMKTGPTSLDCVRIAALLHAKWLEHCLVCNEGDIRISSFIIIAVVGIKHEQAKTSHSIYFILEAWLLLNFLEM